MFYYVQVFSYIKIQNTRFTVCTYIKESTISFWDSLIFCVHSHISFSLLGIWTAVTNSASLYHRLLLLFQSDGYQPPDYSITALMNPVRPLTVLSLLNSAIGSHLSLWSDFIRYSRDMQNAGLLHKWSTKITDKLISVLFSNQFEVHVFNTVSDIGLWKCS